MIGGVTVTKPFALNGASLAVILNFINNNLDTQIENVCIVAKNGNDATAARNSLRFPFLTVNAAKNASVAGDAILVFPGLYQESGIEKPDVYYYLFPGANVQGSAGPVLNITAPGDYFVYGDGIISGQFGNRPLLMNDPGAVLTFEGELRVSGTGGGINIFNGEVNGKGNIVIENRGVINFYAGSWNWEGDIIKNTFSGSIGIIYQFLNNVGSHTFTHRGDILLKPTATAGGNPRNVGLFKGIGNAATNNIIRIEGNCENNFDDNAAQGWRLENGTYDIIHKGNFSAARELFENFGKANVNFQVDGNYTSLSDRVFIVGANADVRFYTGRIFTSDALGANYPNANETAAVVVTGGLFFCKASILNQFASPDAKAIWVTATQTVHLSSCLMEVLGVECIKANAAGTDVFIQIDSAANKPPGINVNPIISTLVVDANIKA